MPRFYPHSYHRGFQEHALDFSPGGKYLATSSFDGSVRLWEASSGKDVRRLTGHLDVVFGAAFSPDGQYILRASNDNTARLWLTDLDDTIQAVCALLTRQMIQHC